MNRPGLGVACVFAALTGCNPPQAGLALPALVFGRTGMGANEFSYPRAAVLAPDGRLYVVDKAARVQCYSQSGEFVCDWMMPESSAGKPTGLGVGPAVGRERFRLYVADTHHHRVLIFDPEGRELDRFGAEGKGPGQFNLPTDVAVARDGCIYVSEYGGNNDRISKFSPSHDFLLSFGGPDAGAASQARPQSLVFDPDGPLWVADACHHRICRFSTDGALLSAFGQEGTGPGDLRFPYSLDLLSDGTLVICEFGNNRVQRVDKTGRCLGLWGAAGREPGQLAYPWATAVGEHDRLFIVDSGNNRIQAVDALAATTWTR